MSQIKLSPGAIATLACMLEVAAPKPGNVHRGADFEDVTFVDFATSAVVLGNVIESNAGHSMGQTILAAVQQTQAAVGTNTNLGMILLIVPLAKIAAAKPAEPITTELVENYLSGIANGLAPQDAADVFEAIRIANPGGLGEADEMDVNAGGADPVSLLEAMRLAAGRDAIARQFVTGFSDVIDKSVLQIVKGRNLFKSLTEGIVFAHVESMSRDPDSLIARKCGAETAQHSQMLANKAMSQLEGDGATGSDKSIYWTAVGELDFWLRSDGHRRNPGTTADLIAASLFVGIHNGTIKMPFN